MRQKEAEQPVQFMADAEGIDFIMESGDISDFDAVERPFDGGITAFFPKGFFCAVVALHGAENGREG